VGILDETRFIERLQFFNGQRLFASDLQGLEAFNREMRWLHNRSLHQPGIGNGLAVYGQKGERQVSIGPGYAIDALGREIVLTETQVEPVPPVSGEHDGTSVFYDLTISYPDDSDLEVAETRDGVCLPRGVVRLREAPEFCWVRLTPGNFSPKSAGLAKDIQDGLKIVLARVELLNCQLHQPVSIAQRRSARPAKLPYVAGGVAEPTRWQEQPIPGLSSFVSTRELPFSTFALKADIDTTAAGFLTTPFYAAHIPGPRVMTVSVEGEPGPTTPEATVLIVDQVHVQDTLPERFSFFLLGIVLQLSTGDLGMDPTSRAIFLTEKVTERIKATWNVVWMGAEG
jgi:hypothetical protein